jgi:hypothetical protein
MAGNQLSCGWVWFVSWLGWFGLQPAGEREKLYSSSGIENSTDADLASGDNGLSLMATTAMLRWLACSQRAIGCERN